MEQYEELEKQHREVDEEIALQIYDFHQNIAEKN